MSTSAFTPGARTSALTSDAKKSARAKIYEKKKVKVASVFF